MTQKQTVLIVDGQASCIDVIKHCLDQEYEISAALSGKRAIKIAARHPKPDIILLDVVMPDMDGYAVCKELKNNPKTSHIPIIFVTVKNETNAEELAFEAGAIDFINKPVSPAVVRARVRTQLALYRQNQEFKMIAQLRTRELEETRLQIIRNLGRAAEFKDNETGMHVLRMSHYSRLLAKATGANPDWVKLIYAAAPMHDIGKIGIPDHILLKAGKLSDEEWEIMKKHPLIGSDIIGNHDSELLKVAREIALYHHEKWDGSGYPEQLKGDDIPLSAQIVAIADVFDALTTERPYKKAWDVDEAFAYMQAQAGTHFQPELIDLFLSKRADILTIKDTYADNGLPSTKMSA